MKTIMLTMKNSAVLPGATIPQTCRIIPFPGTAAKTHAPEQPEPRLSFEEHCAAFRGANFGAIKPKILWTLYYCRIHSLEELAEKTVLEKLERRRGVGHKTLELIQTALESRGIAPGSEQDFPA